VNGGGRCDRECLMVQRRGPPRARLEAAPASPSGPRHFTFSVPMALSSLPAMSIPFTTMP